MSNEALTWAFRQRAPSAGAKSVLVALADLANHEHRAWPGQAKLAAMTQQAPRTVLRHLQELEAAGLVERERRNEGYKRRLNDAFKLPVRVVATAGGRPLTGSADRRRAGGQTSHANSTRVKATPDEIVEDRRQVGTIKKPKDLTTPTGGGSSTNPLERTMISEGWCRSPADIEWQHNEGIPDDFARPVTGEFVRYWLECDDRRALKTEPGWSRAWRNWVSKEWRDKGPKWLRDRASPQQRALAAQRAAFNNPSHAASAIPRPFVRKAGG